MSQTIQVQRRQAWEFGCRINGATLTEHRLTAPDAGTALDLHDEAFPNHEFVACVPYIPKQRRHRLKRCESHS